MPLSDHSDYANCKAEKIVYPLRFKVDARTANDLRDRIAQAIDDAYADPKSHGASR